MKQILQGMWHWTVANAQVGISYAWLAGYFYCVVLTGEGKMTVSTLAELTPITMLMMSFWFQRQRESGDTKPTAPGAAPSPTPTPTPPPQGAPQ